MPDYILSLVVHGFEIISKQIETIRDYLKAKEKYELLISSPERDMLITFKLKKKVKP